MRVPRFLGDWLFGRGGSHRLKLGFALRQQLRQVVEALDGDVVAAEQVDQRDQMLQLLTQR